MVKLRDFLQVAKDIVVIEEKGAHAISVDEKTARICMDLLSIYFKNGGCKGVVMAFRDDPYDSVGVQPLTTEEAVDIAMMAPFSCNTWEKAENEGEE